MGQLQGVRQVTRQTNQLTLGSNNLTNSFLYKEKLNKNCPEILIRPRNFEQSMHIGLYICHFLPVAMNVSEARKSKSYAKTGIHRPAPCRDMLQGGKMIAVFKKRHKQFIPEFGKLG